MLYGKVESSPVTITLRFPLENTYIDTPHTVCAGQIGTAIADLVEYLGGQSGSTHGISMWLKVSWARLWVTSWWNWCVDLVAT